MGKKHGGQKNKAKSGAPAPRAAWKQPTVEPISLPVQELSVSAPQVPTAATKPRNISLSREEWILLVIGTLLAIASLPSSDPWIVFPMLGLSWIAFLWLLYFHVGNPLYRVATGIGVTIILGLVVTRLYRTIPKPLAVQLPIIQYSCTLRPLGIDIQPNTEAYIVTFHNGFTINIQVRSAGNVGDKWPQGIEAAAARHDPINFMDQCEISNVGAIDAFNLTLILTANFYSSGRLPRPVFSPTKEIMTDSVLPGKPFVFYLVNQSDFQVNIAPSETVSVQPQGERRKITVRLDRTDQTFERGLPMLVGLPPTFSVWKGDTIAGRKP